MKLNYKRTVLIGLAFLSICAFWQMYDSIIPLILQNTFGIGETLTGAITRSFLRTYNQYHRQWCRCRYPGSFQGNPVNH